MPKQRTHSGAKKRFRVTKKGKVMHRRQNRNHILEKKAAKRKLRLSRDGQLEGADAGQIKRLLTGR
jgi:large subunit ribosomal protein L35